MILKTLRKLNALANRAAGVGLAGLEALPALVLLCWTLGQLLRDRWLLTALCFYIPSPLCLGLLWLGALGWAGSGHGGRARAALVVSVLPLLSVLLVENRWAGQDPPPPPEGRGYRLVHWTLDNADFGWPRIVDTLARERADIYLLSELPTRYSLRPLLEALGPEYRSERASKVVVVVAREPFHLEEYLPTEGGRSQVLVWKYDGHRVPVLTVDLASNPLQPRPPRLAWVRRRMLERRPMLVVGDFNTPRRAAYLSQLPRGYAHAYERAGSGWSYTWPMPLPVLAIDQCLVREDLRVLDYRLRRNFLSLHRMQVLDFLPPRTSGSSVFSSK